MSRLSLATQAFFILLTAGLLTAQTGPRDRINQPINEGIRVTLPGNIHPSLSRSTSSVPAAATTPMEHMILHLQIRPEQDIELESLIARQSDPAAPEYHTFLTPEEFATRFGASASEIAKVSGWLQNHGFSVDEVADNNLAIIFSGTVSQVNDAFRTEMRHLTVDGVRHLANAREPQIPAALSGIVGGVVKLHDFRHPAQSVSGAPIGSLQRNSTLFTQGTTRHLLAPADYYTIYNINPLLNAGIDGTGQSIAVLARSNIYLSEVQGFRSMFGLPANDPQLIVTNRDPGQVARDNVETTLDAEWAGAVAPGATVKVVISASTGSSDGIDLSAIYAVNKNVAPIISVSYGACEADMGGTELAFYHSLWKQAAAQGQTVLVGSGDSGAAGCDPSGAKTAVKGQAVNGLCSSPYSTCVGGTQFMDGSSPNQYWLSANDSVTLASALSYIPETVWNESGTSNGGAAVVAGGGGASTVYAKPAWQSGPGVPADGKRDVPDVSLTAALHDGYTVVQGGMVGYIFPVGGTSASTPSFAGMVAMVNQKNKSAQGCVNPVLYPLAAKQAAGGTAIFHQITTGNNSVPGVVGFSAGPGYNQATGLGSVDANLLINHWNDAATPSGPLTIYAYPVSVSQGQSTSAVIRTATSGLSSAVALTLSGVPSGVTASLTPATVAAPGSGSTTLNLTASPATAPGVYTLTIAGIAGSQTATSTFSLTVMAPTFGLAVPTESMGMQNGSTITAPVAITPQYGFSGTVTLSASGLPAGVTATFSPATLSGSTAGASVMTIVAANSAHGGFYRFDIKATSGSLSQMAQVSLAVNVVPSCKMVSTPNNITVAPGATTTITLTCPSATSAITMNTFSVPSGMTATLSSSTLGVNQAVKLTVSASSTAVQGSTVMGIYATEANGALQEPNIPITVTGPDSALTLNPATITLTPGGSATVGVSWSATGFPNANLGVGSRPQGVSVSFGPVTATNGSLTFSASSTAVAGNYTILIQGFGGFITRSATLNVVISGSGQSACALAATPNSLGMATGGSITASVTCAVTQGSFSAPLSLSVSPLNPASAAAGTATGLTVQAPTTMTAGSSATVTIKGSNAVKPGSYQLQVTASGGGFSKTVTVPLTVTAPPVCTLAAAPASVSVTPNQSTAVKLTCAATQGTFSAPLTLVLTGLPSGITAQASPATLTVGSSSTLTISAAGTAKAGTAPIFLMAAGSGFTQTIPIPLTVTGFALTTAQSSVTVKAGSTAQVTLQSQLSGAFNAAVTLTATGLPAGVSVSFSKATLAAPGSGTALVTFKTTSAAKAGAYQVSLTGNGGGTASSVSLPLTVTK